MLCSNCHKKITPSDTKIIHTRYDSFGGVHIGDIHYRYHLDFCSKECACNWISDASDAANEKCENCEYTYWENTDKLLCNHPKCPYQKCAEEARIRKRVSDATIKQDGGIIKHIFKTCKRFYFG